jgi:hypothetical protein
MSEFGPKARHRRKVENMGQLVIEAVKPFIDLVKTLANAIEALVMRILFREDVAQQRQHQIFKIVDHRAYPSNRRSLRTKIEYP